MNKGDLINKVAEESNITKAQATTAVNAMFNAIGSALQGNDKATIIGFGTFSVSKREARSGRNPRTGSSRSTSKVIVDIRRPTTNSEYSYFRSFPPSRRVT